MYVTVGFCCISSVEERTEFIGVDAGVRGNVPDMHSLNRVSRKPLETCTRTCLRTSLFTENLNDVCFKCRPYTGGEIILRWRELILYVLNHKQYSHLYLR